MIISLIMRMPCQPILENHNLDQASVMPRLGLAINPPEALHPKVF